MGETEDEDQDSHKNRPRNGKVSCRDEQDKCHQQTQVLERLDAKRWKPLSHVLRALPVPDAA